MGTMVDIFVNYRRGSHSVAVVALVEELARHFGADAVFLDLRIRSGAQYPGLLDDALRSCSVLVAVMHDDWLAGFDTERDKDWVRYEIDYALRNDKAVVPVLLEDATLPRRGELDEIGDLITWNATRVRAETFRVDIDRLVRVIEDHVIPRSPVPATPPADPPAKRVGLRVAAWTTALFLLAPMVLFESNPLWLQFAFPAFGSAVLLVTMAVLSIVPVIALSPLAALWGQNVGARSHREILARRWGPAALIVVAVAYETSESMTKDGGWQEWEVWFVIVLAVLAAYFLHRWWRRRAADDHAWPPPVTTEHGVFRRACLRLHDKLLTDKDWRLPRTKAIQREAETIYQRLTEVRAELSARAAMSPARWVRSGFSAEATGYVGWFISIVALDVVAFVIAVLGPGVGWGACSLIVAAVGAAAVATAAKVTVLQRVDRRDIARWVAELTERQQVLAPLIFGENANPGRD
jgi:hypothetical protein